MRNEIPKTHHLTKLEVKLLNTVQTLLRDGPYPYPEGIRHLLSKIQRRPT